MVVFRSAWMVVLRSTSHRVARTIGLGAVGVLAGIGGGCVGDDGAAAVSEAWPPAELPGTIDYYAGDSVRKAWPSPLETFAEKGGSAGRGAPPPMLGIPVRGVLADELEDNFGVPRGSRRHLGLDIWAPRGSEVVAAVDGWVWRMKWDRRGGRVLYLVDASMEYILLYAHLDAYAEGLSEGQPVRRGEVLGYVGVTGNVRGSPHLHLQLGRIPSPERWWEMVPVNPYPFLKPPPPPEAADTTVAEGLAAATFDGVHL